MPRHGAKPSAMDLLFGGEPGAARRARAGMINTYGRKHGETVFQAAVVKRSKRKRKPQPTRRPR